MPTPYFVADSAQVTVLRSLASTAFGKYGLKLPEGIDLEDVYEVSAAGNELAYVSSLGSARRVGGMFRRFVRSDVNVTAQGEDMVPASDVERVLDEAAKRVSGDFFLESDISKAGLGPWVPFVDFHVGDIANVEIWGRVVPLAVTRIEPKRTDHSDDDWSVHVGGQLLSDADARLAQNTDIYNAVVNDRRELSGLETKTSQAAAAASRAQSTADSAAADARDVREALGGPGASGQTLVEQLGALNAQLTTQGEEPQPGLLPAYLDLNTRLWEQQEQINEQNDEFRRLTEQLDAQQTEQIEQITSIQKQLVDESSGRIRELMATPAGTSDPSIKSTSRDDGKPGWQVNLPDVTAGGVFHVQWYTEKSAEDSGGSWMESKNQLVRNMDKDYHFYTLKSHPEEKYIFARWVTMNKRQVTVNKSGGDWGLSRGLWTTVMTHFAPTKPARQVALRLKVTWAAATHDDRYGIRIRAGSRTLREYTTSGLGPLTFLGDGVRWMSVTVSDATIQPGETIRVDVYSTATLPGGRRVKNAELTGTWIEEV